MTISLIFLAIRATTIAYSRVLASKCDDDGLAKAMPPVPDLVLSRKLVLPGRIFYVLLYVSTSKWENRKARELTRGQFVVHEVLSP